MFKIWSPIREIFLKLKKTILYYETKRQQWFAVSTTGTSATKSPTLSYVQQYLPLKRGVGATMALYNL